MPHVYEDRPTGYVLVDRVWRPFIARMRFDDGRLDVQVTIDGDNRLETVAGEAVVWDE